MLDLLPVELPPGIQRRGVQIESKGRWYDSNMVRWDNQSVEPVGGWVLFSPQTEGTQLVPANDVGDTDSFSPDWTLGDMWNWLSGNPPLSVTGINLSAAGPPGSSATVSGVTGLTVGNRYRIYVETFVGNSISEPIELAVLLNGQQSQSVFLTTTDTNFYVDMTLESASGSTGLIHLEGGSGGLQVTLFEIRELTTEDLDFSSFGAIRGAHSWNSNEGTPYIAMGSYNSLRIMNGNRIINNITPPTLAVGVDSSRILNGYGSGNYGAGPYGVSSGRNTSQSPATNWTIDNWGENLVGVSDSDQGIYELALSDFEDGVVTTASLIVGTGVPICESLIVTQERILIAIAADGNPRKIKWCDRENNTVWVPSSTNEAGDLELQTSGRLVCAENVRGRTLILSTQDAFVVTYLQPPLVYGAQKVGGACGIAGRNLSCAVGPYAYWMGHNDFYWYDGSEARVLPCEVRDYVFNNINKDFISHAYCVSNQQFGEVWWVYPGPGRSENSEYVYFNYRDNYWGIGTLFRTSAIDSGVFDNPIHFSTDYIYEHEVGLVHSDVGPGEVTFDYPPFLRSGPININNGADIYHVLQVLNDERVQGQCQLTFYGKYYPNDTEYEYGPYQFDNPTDVRFSARQFSMLIEAQDGDDWRIGPLRLYVAGGGRR